LSIILQLKKQARRDLIETVQPAFSMNPMVPFIPAIFYALLTIFVFVKIQDWMARNGFPILAVSRYVEDRVTKIPLPNGHEDHSAESTESGPLIVVIDENQENQDALEKYDEPEAGFRRFSQDFIVRQEKLKASTFSLQKINDAIISAFTDFVSKIKEQIGDTSEITIAIHDLLLKYNHNAIF
jgi:hypothetical protein